jgi:hypothetical protein
VDVEAIVRLAEPKAQPAVLGSFAGEGEILR